MKFEVC